MGVEISKPEIAFVHVSYGQTEIGIGKLTCFGPTHLQSNTLFRMGPFTHCDMGINKETVEYFVYIVM